MITITKGNDKITCSYKTYEDQYKQLGYVLASEIEKEVKKAKVEPLQEEKVSEDEKIGAKYGTRKRTTSKSKKGE